MLSPMFILEYQPPGRSQESPRITDHLLITERVLPEKTIALEGGLYDIATPVRFLSSSSFTTQTPGVFQSQCGNSYPSCPAGGQGEPENSTVQRGVNMLVALYEATVLVSVCVWGGNLRGRKRFSLSRASKVHVILRKKDYSQGRQTMRVHIFHP